MARDGERMGEGAPSTLAVDQTGLQKLTEALMLLAGKADVGQELQRKTMEKLTAGMNPEGEWLKDYERANLKRQAQYEAIEAALLDGPKKFKVKGHLDRQKIVGASDKFEASEKYRIYMGIIAYGQTPKVEECVDEEPQTAAKPEPAMAGVGG